MYRTPTRSETKRDSPPTPNFSPIGNVSNSKKINVGTVKEIDATKDLSTRKRQFELKQSSSAQVRSSPNSKTKKLEKRKGGSLGYENDKEYVPAKNRRRHDVQSSSGGDRNSNGTVTVNAQEEKTSATKKRKAVNNNDEQMILPMKRRILETTDAQPSQVQVRNEDKVQKKPEIKPLNSFLSKKTNEDHDDQMSARNETMKEIEPNPAPLPTPRVEVMVSLSSDAEKHHLEPEAEDDRKLADDNVLLKLMDDVLQEIKKLNSSTQELVEQIQTLQGQWESTQHALTQQQQWQNHQTDNNLGTIQLLTVHAQNYENLLVEYDNLLQSHRIILIEYEKKISEREDLREKNKILMDELKTVKELLSRAGNAFFQPFIPSQTRIYFAGLVCCLVLAYLTMALSLW